MKTIILCLVVIFIATKLYAQNGKHDILNHVYYTDASGNKKKVIVATPPQMLIVSGDSIYTISNEYLLKKHLEKQKGFDIINNSDSIYSFIRNRIKAIVVLKEEDR